jgi:hemoglobin
MEASVSTVKLAAHQASPDTPNRPDLGKNVAPRSLYERLGGAHGISAIVDDVIALHLSNPLIKTRFATISAEKLSVLKKITCDFFGAGSGGPEIYSGRDLVTAHKGMNISEQELIAAIDDVVAALGKNGVGQNEQNEVVAILYSLKNQVVRL